MESFVAQAVHYNDCFEHERASHRMKLVADYYESLSSLFCEALPGVFPDRVRSHLRAKALGTRVQSEMFLGLSDPIHLEVARQLSEDAVEEFESVSDKQRQYQYRCEVETAAGNLAEARTYLARSLQLSDDLHKSIGHSINELDAAGVGQGFAILHWFRIGASALLSGNADEAGDFLQAIRDGNTLHTPWCLGEIPQYPAHGILRRITIVHAGNANRDQALAALQMLRALAGAQPSHLVLTAILLAAQTELSGAIWNHHLHHARQLLDNKNSERLGLLQTLDQFKKSAATTFPKCWEHFENWPDQITAVLTDNEPPAMLIQLGGTVGY